MSTRTIALVTTETTETLPANTPALSVARFAREYRDAHGEAAPTEVHTAPMWAGPDSAEAHELLCMVLAADASTLEAVGSDGYVLLRGAGDGCDVWARYTTV